MGPGGLSVAELRLLVRVVHLLERDDVLECRHRRNAPPLDGHLVGGPFLDLTIGVRRIETDSADEIVLHDIGSVTGIDPVFTVAVLDGNTFFAAYRDGSRVLLLIGLECAHSQDRDDGSQDEDSHRDQDACGIRTTGGVARHFQAPILWKGRDNPLNV